MNLIVILSIAFVSYPLADKAFGKSKERRDVDLSKWDVSNSPLERPARPPWLTTTTNIDRFDEPSKLGVTFYETLIRHSLDRFKIQGRGISNVMGNQFQINEVTFYLIIFSMTLENTVQNPCLLLVMYMGKVPNVVEMLFGKCPESNVRWGNTIKDIIEVFDLPFPIPV